MKTEQIINLAETKNPDGFIYEVEKLVEIPENNKMRVSIPGLP